MPTFTCDLAAAVPFEHVREHTVACDHAPIALVADWQAQLRRCRTKLGFMPQMLASGSTTIFRYRGNVTPRNYGQWAILIRTLVEHWLRHGGDDVSRWCTSVIQGPRRAGFEGGWL